MKCNVDVLSGLGLHQRDQIPVKPLDRLLDFCQVGVVGDGDDEEVDVVAPPIDDDEVRLQVGVAVLVAVFRVRLELNRNRPSWKMEKVAIGSNWLKWQKIEFKSPGTREAVNCVSPQESSITL